MQQPAPEKPACPAFLARLCSFHVSWQDFVRVSLYPPIKNSIQPQPRNGFALRRKPYCLVLDLRTACNLRIFLSCRLIVFGKRQNAKKIRHFLQLFTVQNQRNPESRIRIGEFTKIWVLAKNNHPHTRTYTH